MRKMFQFRIYPTKSQEKKLNETLHECRWLYNHLLEKRKEAYEQEGKSLSCYGQQATYPMLKQQHPSLNKVHCLLVGILCPTERQSGRSWAHTDQSQSGLYESDM